METALNSNDIELRPVKLAATGCLKIKSAWIVDMAGTTEPIVPIK